MPLFGLATVVEPDVDNPVVGDLKFVDDDLAWVEDEAEAIVQDLYAVWRTFRGDYWLNLRYGIPYLESILGVFNPDRRTLAGVFLYVLKRRPYVSNVVSFDLTYSANTRTVSIAWKADTTAGLLGGDTDLSLGGLVSPNS